MQPRHRLMKGRRPPLLETLESLALRAVAVAQRRSPSYADSVRVRVVAAVAVLDPSLAHSLLRGLRDSAVRSIALIAIANAWVYENVDSALAYARAAGPSAARDALYGTAVTITYDAPGRALALAGQIENPALRGKALVTLAAFGPGSDSTVARAVAQGIDIVDPAREDFDTINFASVYRMLGLDRLRDWAARQPTAERRAAACVLLVEAIASLP